MGKKKPNPPLTPSQRLLFRKIKKLCDAVRLGLYHYQGPSSPMTLSWSVEIAVSPRNCSSANLPFAEDIVEKLQHYVRQCEAETQATRRSIIDYVIGRINSLKFMHLMHCSCNCRQRSREAQRRQIESAIDGAQPPSMPPSCNCCARHQRRLSHLTFA